MVRFLKPDLEFTLSPTVLSYTTSIAKAFKLEQIVIKGTTALTDDITITLDSAEGSEYDVILRKKSLSAEQYFVYKPEGQSNYQPGDEIVVSFLGTGTLNGIVKTSEIG